MKYSRSMKASFVLAVLAAAVAPPSASAGQLTVGVVDFQNLAGSQLWWSHGTGRDLAVMLSDQLSKTGTFSVMNRLEVSEAEASGGGGRYMVRAAISYYRERGSSRSSRFRVGGINVRGRTRGAEIAVDFEILELAGGRTLHSDTLDSRTRGLDLDVGYYEPEFSGELSQYRDKPAGKAISKVIAKLAQEIERVLKHAPAANQAADAGQPSSISSPASPAAGRAGETVASTGSAAPANVSANYNFEPGSRVLFEDDFSGTPVGDFPHRLNFKKGAMEVVDWNGQRLFRIQDGWQNHFEIPLPETLPDRFTLELDVHDASSPGGDTDRLGIFFGPPPDNGFSMRRPGGEPHVLVSNANGLGVFTYYNEPVSSVEGSHTALAEGLVRIQVQVDGEAIKVYADQDRIANIPSINLGRHDAISILVEAQKDPTYIGNIRIAAGGLDLYSSLQSEGRVAVRDILFETGSARIQPGSDATLFQIAAMLRQHPDLRLSIEGHTDDTGTPSSNLSLSQQRAEAVRDHLVSQAGIDSSRLVAVGMGQEHPVADNGSEEGRALNRRVELVL